MNRTLLIVLIVHMISTLVRAQCNNQLVDIAASQSGKDAVFVHEFKVKLKAGDKKKPSPVGHFPVLLKEGVTYRLNVANANEYEGKAILQLCDKGQILGSTYVLETGTSKNGFDYKCSKTTSYQVLISFKEAKEGCAVGILSMIIDSSLISKQATDTVYEILYKEIRNPLFLNVPLNKGEHFEVTIDSGKIEKNHDVYEALVTSKGYAAIKITILDSMNKTKETNSKVFKVEELPLPYISLAMKNSNFVSKSDIERFPFIELQMPVSLEVQPYKLIDYTVSCSEYPSEDLFGYTDRLTPAQINRISQLESGSKLIFKNIRIRHPNGRIITIPNTTFYIE